ncbi:MAG: V-type ATP synthase subunit E [Candidatus Bipolaricaulota bacterium]|nr:V-type ATP synthase subunit E [Candidatus Bipolaricaulota bacterium]MDW8030456.1 V-type ATP synthase subunit E [Candidatus Bipolaricaulota bacterium]
MELLRQIEAEGERQVQELLAQAERQAQEILAQAEHEIAQERERALKELEAQVDRERQAALSRAHSQARAELLKAKNSVAEALFERLAQEMAQLRSDPARYRRFLERCLREVEQAIPGPLVVRAAPEDQKLLRELLAGTQHTLGDPVKTVGGILALNERGDLVVDNRLETRLANLQARYRLEIGRALAA